MNIALTERTTPESSNLHHFEDESIRTLLLQIAKSLVPGESTVTVHITNLGELSTATMMIAPEHLGRLLGEHGRIARSIRTILTAAAMTFQRRYTLDIKATG